MKRTIVGIMAAALMLFSVSTQAQMKNFTTATGTVDTTVTSTNVLSFYCTNFNPATEAIVQLTVKASTHAHDSLYGVGAVWGSNDGVNYIQLSQLDTYSANFSDSLDVPNTTKGAGVTKTKFWTYDIYRTSQPLPRYWKVIWTNKGTTADTTTVHATLYIPKN